LHRPATSKEVTLTARAAAKRFLNDSKVYVLHAVNDGTIIASEVMANPRLVIALIAE
jgi:hypothetical protein